MCVCKGLDCKYIRLHESYVLNSAIDKYINEYGYLLIKFFFTKPGDEPNLACEPVCFSLIKSITFPLEILEKKSHLESRKSYDHSLSVTALRFYYLQGLSRLLNLQKNSGCSWQL